ncbi:hypothetical protein Pcinc_031241 [Petrolisthes cinctipes]|uniref:Uncharacterized protein n=1 Tax=Petrolisthes cinctipes TaxID=88211 RepID=A0AAE1EWQ6_PETCI|nr:hypothetical protein Pcinc_031241 [Petrolisthes cinctipes]
MYMVDSSVNQLLMDGVQPCVGDPQLAQAPPSVPEVRKSVAKLKEKKVAGGCGIGGELKERGEAMIQGFVVQSSSSGSDREVA